MKFHIIITDNEEGKIILNTEANAIIAGIHEDGGKGHSLAATHCKCRELLGTLDAAMSAIESVVKEHSVLKILFMKRAFELIKGDPEDEEDDE